jgi:hypothetical protein
MSSDNPFAKLGALEQKLFQETTPKPTVPLDEKTGTPSGRKSQIKTSGAKAVSSIPRHPKEVSQSSHVTVIPRHHDTMTPRNHATTIPQEEGGIFEAVRKSVKQIGKEAGLPYVYCGNIPGLQEDTICYRCNTKLIERVRYTVVSNRLDQGRCPSCHAAIPGVWHSANSNTVVPATIN